MHQMLHYFEDIGNLEIQKNEYMFKATISLIILQAYSKDITQGVRVVSIPLAFNVLSLEENGLPSTIHK